MYGNQGCDGGSIENAYRYVKDNRGIDNENSYAYEAKQNVCRFKNSAASLSNRGYVSTPYSDEEKLKEAIATVGPVAAAVDASNPSFQFYSAGVYYELECESTHLDHAVLVVGYGTDENGDDYWLLKNSWGTSWGEQGILFEKNSIIAFNNNTYLVL